jgi:hypothetical protein
MNDKLVYLYGLVRGERAPSLTRAPAGLPGTGPLRVLDGGRGIWLVTGPAPEARYGDAAIERGLKDLDWVSQCAVAHERVIRHFAARAATVPARLFTIFRSDERALVHVRISARRLARVFARVEGCEEWGIRIFAETPPAPPARTPAKTSADVGRRFLERKRDLQRAARATAASAPRAALAAFRRLSRHARAQRKLPIAATGAASRLLLDAAFLVPRERRGDFREAAAAAARNGSRDGIRLALTGPWPAYNFVDEDR